MDPGTIVSVIGLVLQLLGLVRPKRNDGRKRSKRRCPEDLDRSADELYLKLARGIEEKAHAVGIPSNSLDKLHNELRQFISSIKNVFCSNDSQKDDIQQLCEMYVKDSEYIKIARETMQEMLSKSNGIQINIFQGQAHDGNLMPTWPFSYSRKVALWELLCRVMNVDSHLDLVMPTEEVGPYVHLLSVADGGIIKGVEKGGKLMNRKKHQPFFTNERAEMDVLKEEDNMEETPSSMGWREWGQCTTEGQDNPNCNMEVIKKEGSIEICKHIKGGSIEMRNTCCEEPMGMVIGNNPIEMSKMLGYCYFEVKLVEMKRKRTGLAGVGVGLARRDKFRTNAIAGMYSKSCGYDGRVGQVYCERNVREGPSMMGTLEVGDTLGVGLLQQYLGHDHIFFAKNGELKVCYPMGFRWAHPSYGGFYPVISLASAHIQLHVDFQGPFDLSELLMHVKAYIAQGKR